MFNGGRTALYVVAIALLLHFTLASADQIVLKNGKTVRGKKVTETDLALVIQDEKGLFVNIPKSDIDLQKTVQANPPATKNSSKKSDTARVVTKEELEALRDKHDLGLKSYGEAYELQWAETSKIPPDPQSDQEFDQEVLRASLPVLVDFYADWCQPCKVIAPHVDAVAQEFDGKAKVYRINIDEKKSLAQQYKIDAIPTLLFFKNGEIVDQIVGAVQKKVISDRLQAIL